MLLQHWAVLQVALKGLWGGRGGRLWGRETGRRRGDDVNMKEKVKGVGVRFFFYFFLRARRLIILFIWVTRGSPAKFCLLVG